MCFSEFLYQYNESLAFLDVARMGGATASLPPKSTTGTGGTCPTKFKSAHSNLVFTIEMCLVS